MSIEQINLLQLQGLLPTIGFMGILGICCVVVWFLTLGVGLLIEDVKTKCL